MSSIASRRPATSRWEQYSGRSTLQLRPPGDMIETPHAESRRCACRSTRYTARRESRRRRCWRGSTPSWSTSRTSDADLHVHLYVAYCLKGRTGRHPRLRVRSANPIGGEGSKGRCWRPASSRSSACSDPDAPRLTLGSWRGSSTRPSAWAQLVVEPMTGGHDRPSGRTPAWPGDAFSERPHRGHHRRLPGTVLFEGTMLSEARGTTRPFELMGRLDRRPGAGPAPERLPAARRPLPPTVFEPTFHKFAKENCGGVQYPTSPPPTFEPSCATAILHQMPPPIPTGSRGGRRPTITTREASDRHPGRTARYREDIGAARIPGRWPSRGVRRERFERYGRTTGCTTPGVRLRTAERQHHAHLGAQSVAFEV